MSKILLSGELQISENNIKTNNLLLLDQSQSYINSDNLNVSNVKVNSLTEYTTNQGITINDDINTSLTISDGNQKITINNDDDNGISKIISHTNSGIANLSELQLNAQYFSVSDGSNIIGCDSSSVIIHPLLDMRDGMKNKYSACKYKTTSTLYTTSTALTLDTTLYDNSGTSMTSTANRITITKTGIYNISATSLVHNSSTSGVRNFGFNIRRAGAIVYPEVGIYTDIASSSLTYFYSSCSGMLLCDVGDTVQIFCSGGLNTYYEKIYLFVNLVST